MTPVRQRQPSACRCGPPLRTAAACRRVSHTHTHLGLLLVVADAHEVAEGNALHAVAGSAHLLVHLVTTADAAGGETWHEVSTQGISNQTRLRRDQGGKGAKDAASKSNGT